jgi:hypothetical protein
MFEKINGQKIMDKNEILYVFNIKIHIKMNYQTALKIRWIYDFMNSYVKNFSDTYLIHDMEIVEKDDKFYLKTITKHRGPQGRYTETTGEEEIVEAKGTSFVNWQKSLNTCILFEEHKGDPMIFYTHKKSQWHRQKYDVLLYQSLCFDKLTKR